jgi:hypothetical protein
MLVVETIAKIRRAYFSLGRPIKEICRELRVSRKVVRKVIRSDATEFHYERSRQPLPRIGPWRERLESLLEENEGKSAREQLTLIRLYEELRGFGYEGSYAAVRPLLTPRLARRAALTAGSEARPSPAGERPALHVNARIRRFPNCELAPKSARIRGKTTDERPPVSEPSGRARDRHRPRDRTLDHREAKWPRFRFAWKRTRRLSC